MTRKDFEAFAAAVRVLPTETERRQMAQFLLPILRASNPAFDSARFLQACGL